MAYNPKSLENLVSSDKKTHESLVEQGRKGGYVASETKKRKKLLKETIELFLSSINPETNNEYQLDLVNALVQKALEGDVSAFNSLRDTAGQKPKEDVAVVNMPIINIKGL